MLVRNEQLTYEPVKTYTKKQQNLLARAMLVAAIGFILTAAIGFGLFKGITNNIVDVNTYYIIAGISSIVLLGSMIGFMFMRPSILNYSMIFIIYVISSGVSFASLFFSFNMGELMIIFAIAGLTFGITGLLAYILPPKVIGSIVKISFACIMLSFLFSLIFLFVGIFSPLGNAWEWYTYLTVFLGTIFSAGYNISVFYGISRMASFHKEDLDTKEGHLLVLICGFNLLVSLIQIIWRIAYWFRLFKGN